MIRLFLALPPSEKEAQLLWDQWEPARFSSPRVRWLPAHQYHVTLIFFGNVEDSGIPVICNLMDDVSKLYGSFKMRTDGPGQFPEHGSPRVLVEHLSEADSSPRGRLLSLQRLLYQSLRDRFLLEKRNFKAHITTARIKGHFNDSLLPGGYPVSQGISLTLDNIVLFESVLKPDSAVYNPLYNVKFEG